MFTGKVTPSMKKKNILKCFQSNLYILVSTIICCNANNIILNWFLKTFVSYQHFFFQQLSHYSATELLGWFYYHLSPMSKSYFTLKCIKTFPQCYLNTAISLIFQLACSILMSLLIKTGSQRIWYNLSTYCRKPWDNCTQF